MSANSRSGFEGLWSLADQGAVSLGTFVTNVLLARALAPADYGVFALIYGMLVLMNSYHSCAVVYPLSLSGAPGTIEELHKHLRRSVWLTLLLAFPLGLVVVGAALFLGKPEIAGWAILALVFWQVQETLRRGLMAHMRHREAVWGDAVSYLGQAGFVWGYLRIGHASLAGILAIFSATSLVAGSTQISQLRLELKWEPNLLRHLKESWRVSRWAVLANTAVVVPGVAYPWFLALRGTYLAASYQALLNIIGVSNPVMMSVGNVVLPATIRATATGGLKRAGSVVLRYAFLGAGVLLPCYALIFIGPRLFLRILYGATSPYAAESVPLRLLVMAYSVGYVAYLLAARFYGLGESEKVLKGQAAGALAALLVGGPLIYLFGVVGACVGLAVVYGTQVVAFSFLVRMSKSAVSNNGTLAAKSVEAGSGQAAVLQIGADGPRGNGDRQ